MSEALVPGQAPMTPLQQQLALLRQMALQQQDQAMKSQQAAIQARSQPVPAGYRNQGQGVLDSILRPDQDQARAMIQFGAGLGNRQVAPGQRLAQGAGSALDLLQKMRAGRQAQAAALPTMQAEASSRNVDTLTKLHGMYGGSAPQSGTEWARGQTNQYVDEEGNRFFGTSMTSKDGQGKMVWTPLNDGGPGEPVGQYQQAGPKGLTSAERIEEEAESRRKAALSTASAQNAQMALESFQQARASITGMDEALAALQAGANTGPITSLFPSFQAATIALENAQKTMGLDVVGATTFGALSKGELDLALSKALPTNLEEKDLTEWLMKKRSATVKLMQELQKAANFFQSGGLPGEYINMLESEGLFERTEPADSEEFNRMMEELDALLGDDS